MSNVVPTKFVVPRKNRRCGVRERDDDTPAPSASPPSPLVSGPTSLPRCFARWPAGQHSARHNGQRLAPRSCQAQRPAPSASILPGTTASAPRLDPARHNGQRPAPRSCQAQRPAPRASILPGTTASAPRLDPARHNGQRPGRSTTTPGRASAHHDTTTKHPGAALQWRRASTLAKPPGSQARRHHTPKAWNIRAICSTKLE